MKEVIMTVLNRWKQRNVDFTSEKVRTELAEEIEIVLKDKNFNNAVFGDSKDLTMTKIQSESPYNDGWTRKYYKDQLSEELVDNKEEKYIYESPDRGKTIYKRKFNESKRTLVSDKEWKKLTK
jgi:hypothetical protein